MTDYSFELLQYSPNVVSGEFFNLGVLLYDHRKQLIDARFAPDFRRLRCNPLSDMHYLECLRQEFEEKLLSGEGFSSYITAMRRDLSNALQISETIAFRGKEASAEVERLVHSYLATPARQEGGDEGEPAAGSRRALRRQMEETFRRYYLIGNGARLHSQTAVSYGGPRMRFTFDYSYQPNGLIKCLHALGLHNDVGEASKLCFVFERLRARSQPPPQVTAVVDDSFPADTRDLLEQSEVAVCPSSKLEDLSLAIRRELRL